MAITVKTGQADTTYLATNRLVIDMDDVSLLDPNEAPFLALLTRMGKKECHNFKFEHIEREFAPRWNAINLGGGYNNSATSVVVDDAEYFTARDLVLVPRTGEVFYVTSSTESTNTLVIVRGFGDTSGAAMVDNEPLQIIGNTSEQGTTRPALKWIQGANIYNYTQIFRHAFGASRTEENSEVYGTPTRPEARKEWGVTHSRDIERAFLFGTRDTGTGTNGKVRTTTRGLIPWIDQGSSNVVNANGSLTETEWETFMRALFQYASGNTRIVLCSDLVLSVISGWARGKLRTLPSDETYGINITRYISPHGKVNLINHKLLSGAIYGGYAVGVDISSCAYRYLRGGNTKLMTNIHAPSTDGYEDEYLTECGLMFKHPNRHAYVKGVTS